MRRRDCGSGSTRFADLRAVSETGSTNADVRDLLRARRPGDASATSPVVLVADHQTAGRGRLDRSWQAPPGASVLMSIGLPVDQLAPARQMPKPDKAYGAV
jgi:BirA family biotin operon repressor/biotin-[acetyl-CoA-carboxylase] ligase